MQSLMSLLSKLYNSYKTPNIFCRLYENLSQISKIDLQSFNLSHLYNYVTLKIKKIFNILILSYIFSLNYIMYYNMIIMEKKKQK